MAAPPPFASPSKRRRWPIGWVGLAVVAALLAPWASVGAALGPVPVVPPSPHAAALAKSAIAPGSGREPLRPMLGRSLGAPAGIPRAGVSPSIAWFNNSSCDPNWPANTPLGIEPIHANVTWSGNTSGPAPLTIGWSVNISGGGIPPYQTVVDFEMIPAMPNSPNSTSGNGSVTLTTPGLYYGVAAVIDSTCDADAAAYLSPITVYAPGGVDPVQLSANVTAGAAPLAVNYSLNASRLPPNGSVVWESPVVGSRGASWDNTTYYQSGLQNASVCVLNATGTWLACGSSPKVNVTTSAVTTAARVANGTEPVYVTYWVNVTNASLLPTGWTTYLTLDNGTLLIVGSQNLSTNATELFGCDANSTTSPPNGFGECSWVASWMILDPSTSTLVARGSIWANVSETGAPAQWFPAVTYSLTPTNGSAPINVTLNLTAANAVAPYSYWWAMFGTSSGLANRTFYPTQTGNGTGWNGSRLSLTIPISRTGLYLVTATIGDANHALVFVYPRVVTAGVALAPAGLHLTANESAPTDTTGHALVAFSVSVQGGSAPYTVAWSFGDGTFGSSVPGAELQHAYGAPGTYVPGVTVTDGSGGSVRSGLPPVVVTAAPAHSGTNGTPDRGSSSSGDPGGAATAAAELPGGLALAALVVAGTAVALVIAAVTFARRDRRATEMARALEHDASLERGAR